jgi:hypothetical protein
MPLRVAAIIPRSAASKRDELVAGTKPIPRQPHNLALLVALLVVRPFVVHPLRRLPSRSGQVRPQERLV